MQTDRDVFIAHADAKTSAGLNVQSLWTNILNQKSGISLHKHFLPQRDAAIGLFDTDSTFVELLLDCVKNVVEKSSVEPKDIALFIGSSVGGMQNTENILKQGSAYSDIDPALHAVGMIKNLLLPYFKFKETFAFSTACTSSANALGFAYECVKKGVYSDILVIGADAISLTTVNGFDALGVLSPSACRPFCQKSGGMNVGEGIGALLISDKKTADSVEFLGAGYSSDAHHMTHPRPDGEGAAAAMHNALLCAGLVAKDIGYINAHGTGTKANDTAEASAISSLFKHLPLVSSTKHITGHTLGASGAIEAIITYKAILEGTIPPNCAIDEMLGFSCSFANEPVKKELRYAMSNSFAFGGNNTSLIFGKII